MGDEWQKGEGGGNGGIQQAASFSAASNGHPEMQNAVDIMKHHEKKGW